MGAYYEVKKDYLKDLRLSIPDVLVPFRLKISVRKKWLVGCIFQVNAVNGAVVITMKLLHSAPKEQLEERIGHVNASVGSLLTKPPGPLGAYVALGVRLGIG